MDSSINIESLNKIVQDGIPAGGPDIDLYSVTADLGDIEREIEIDITVGNYSDTVSIEHALEGTTVCDVVLPIDDLMERVQEEGYGETALGYLLHHLSDGERSEVVRALGRADEADAAAMEVEAPTPTPDFIPQDATVHTLGCLTRGTKFWVSRESLTAYTYTYDERVPATTWGEHLTDDTEVWIEELAPAPETDDTEKSLYSASSVRDLVGMILADDERRLLLIGLLVEAGYAVEKKVS